MVSHRPRDAGEQALASTVPGGAGEFIREMARIGLEYAQYLGWTLRT